LAAQAAAQRATVEPSIGEKAIAGSLSRQEIARQVIEDRETAATPIGVKRTGARRRKT
jgi:hypothetical protein